MRNKPTLSGKDNGTGGGRVRDGSRADEVEASLWGTACHVTSPAHEVTVLFRDNALTFQIPVGSTLADLATQLTEIASRQRGQVVCLAVKLSVTR